MGFFDFIMFIYGLFMLITTKSSQTWKIWLHQSFLKNKTN